MFVGTTGVRPRGGAHRRADERARHRRRRGRTAASRCRSSRSTSTSTTRSRSTCSARETSTNAANYYTAGLKGRWQEDRRKDDHLLHRRRPCDVPSDRGRRRSADERGAGADRAQHRPARRVHRRLRRTASSAGTASWRTPASTQRLKLPHAGFNRKVGAFAGHRRHPGRRAARRRERVGAPPGRLAAHRRRQDVRAVADAAGATSPARSPPGSPRRATASTASRSTTTTSTSPDQASIEPGGAR